VVNAAFKIGLLLFLSVLGLLGLRVYLHMRSDADRLARSEAQVEQLTQVIGRLEFERRVADFGVASQKRDAPDAGGKLRTRLMMVEYDRQNRPLPARSFEVVGDQIHIDGLVIKFENELVKADHPLRGRALLLFEKIYGDAQAPADAPRLDAPGQVPAVYRDADPKVGPFELSLWKQFWQLADDPALRKQHGVKVAHGTGVFAPFKPGRRYAVTLGADGDVTLYDEPLPSVLAALLEDRPK
jgi:hypothetical protein